MSHYTIDGAVAVALIVMAWVAFLQMVFEGFGKARCPEWAVLASALVEHKPEEAVEVPALLFSGAWGGGDLKIKIGLNPEGDGVREAPLNLNESGAILWCSFLWVVWQGYLLGIPGLV